MHENIPEQFSINTIEVAGDFGILCERNGVISICESKETAKKDFDEMREEYLKRGGTWPNSFALMQLSFPTTAIDIKQEDLMKILPTNLQIKKASNVSGQRTYIVADKSKFESYLKDGIML